MRAVAIDDDEQMHKLLADMLELIGAKVDIVGTATQVDTGIEVIEAQQPDLLFLDIELPDGTGFDLLERIDHGRYLVIFISGHGQYGRRALEFEALDYLDKPLRASDLSGALLRARRRFEQRNYAQRIEDLNVALQNFQEQKLPTRLTVSNSDGIYVIPLDEILYLFTRDKVVRVVHDNGKPILKSGALKTFAGFFDQDKALGFMQVRDTHIVNLRRVRMIRGDNTLEMDNGDEIPISTRIGKDLRDRLEDL